jgi:hypothetical protein
MYYAFEFVLFTKKTTHVIHAEVVFFVAGSLEAEGLPGYPEVLVSLK